MSKLNVDDSVRLTHDLPQLSLTRGAVGVVCSKWFAPRVAYEVEFCTADGRSPTRALLEPDLIEAQEQEASHIVPEHGDIPQLAGL